MNLDEVVMNIQPYKERDDSFSWVAEQVDGKLIKVEPDNYEFWRICGAYTIYTRKNYTDEQK